MKSAILILTVAALCLTARGVSLSASCDARHGIYFPGQRVTLTFSARELRQPLEFSLRITDEFDRELHSERRPVEPDADGNWRVSIEAPAPRLGFYRVYPKLSDGTTIPAVSSRPAGCLTYAVIVDPARRHQYPQERSFFGLVGNSEDFSFLPMLGISWSQDGRLPVGGRIWFLREPSGPGKAGQTPPPPPPVNPVISMKTPAGELRWKLYGYFDLAYMPQWMRTPVYHRDAPAAGEKKRFLNGPFTPAGEREFRRICREVAAARAALTPAGERNFYEFCWEPHYPWNWTGTPDDIVTRYRIGAEEVRAADPHAFILGPNGAGLTAEYLQYYRDLFARGIGEFIDGISIHPYPKGYPPESRNMAELIRLLKELSRNSVGRELPIYALELGFLFPGDAAGDLKQMRGFLRSNLILLGEGVRTNYNFILTNTGVEMDYSMIHNLDPKLPWVAPASTPRAVIPALSALTWYLEGSRSAGSVDGLGLTGAGYAYERDSRVTLAVWDFSGDPREVEIPVGRTSLVVADHMGNERTLPAPDGVLKLTLTEDVQYLLDVSPELWGSRAFRFLDVETASGCAGEFLEISGTVKADSKPLSGVLKLSCGPELGSHGSELPLNLAPGGESPFRFRLPVPRETEPGEYELKLRLESAGRLRYALSPRIRIVSPVRLEQIVPVVSEEGRCAWRLRLHESAGRDFSGKISLRFPGIPESRMTRNFELAAGDSCELIFSRRDLDWNPLRARKAEISILGRNGWRSMTEVSLSTFAISRLPGSSDEAWRQIQLYPVSGLKSVVASPSGYRGRGDISGEVGAAWDERYLYLRFVVRDDVFCQPYNGIETWQGDCVQVAFAAREVEGSANRLAHTRQLGYSEYTLALTPRGPELYRTITFDGIRFPKALADSDVFPLKIRRHSSATGETIEYWAAFPWEALPVKPQPGARLGWSFTINDRDEANVSPLNCTRLGAFELKEPAQFGTVVLDPRYPEQSVK